ncbi:hypothetical protein GCM10019016_079970 [Streptomyces prasinosporus]|uniref:Uncharacterized protein n=1 Tax=Streptomyces prasinosporus TaxID=68256 RepID=A0ABP6TZW3_9ACTN|nr:hypothetical protein GCM10010332_50180 [Streptomyces albogriseolus]
MAPSRPRTSTLATGRERNTEGGRRESDGGEGSRDDLNHLRQLLPQHEYGDGAHTQAESGSRAGRLRGIGEHPRQPGDLGQPLGGSLDPRHGVQLARDQHQADSGQHALDDRHRDRPEVTPELQGPHEELKQARGEHDGTEGRETEFPDGFEDQHGQPRGGTADLEAAAGQQAGDKAAHDAGDEPELCRHAGRDGDAHAQRQGDEEDDE